MSESRIKILEKTLESKLDDHFAIVPKELFEEAQEQAFQEMDADECTEDQCIRMIQELLQIENAFKMDLIIDEGDTQISITWNDQDQKRVQEDYCEGCKTKGLRLMIGGLVEKLVGGKPIVMVENTKVVRKGILFRDTPYTKFVEGGKKWIKFGDEKTQVKFEGEIVDGVPNGEGTENFPNGQKYFGEFKDGLPNGQGIKTFPNGWKYVGESKDGKRHGQGTFTFSDGRKYEGEWNGGLFYGKGTYTFPDGKKYVGEWKDGKKHGKGTDTFPDGKKYVGEYKDGKIWNGQGTDSFPDGREYVGEFKNGKKNGQGTLTFFNGDKYVGEFKDGLQNGQGTFTFSDGRKYVGKFKDGKPWKGTMYDEDGKYKWKYVKGVSVK